MKKIILSLVCIVMLCGPVFAEEIINKDNFFISNAINIIKDTKAGYFIPIVIKDKSDEGIDYNTSYTMTIATFDVLNTGQKLDLDVGYVTENTLIGGLSYEIGGLKKFSEIPILDLINLSVGLFGSYDCEDAKIGCGLNVRVIKWEF